MPLNVTSREVPMSASTAIHIVPLPSKTRTRKASLIPRATTTLVLIVRVAARLSLRGPRLALKAESLT